jgi:hypothetical protein
MHFLLLNPTEFHDYRVTSIVLLSRIIFWSSASSGLSLAIVLYTFNARLL